MRSARLYLEDMVASAQAVGRYIDGMSREAFLEDERTQDAVLMKLVIIGEAAARVPEEFRGTYPEVPWRQIAAFRNFAVHAYFALSWSQVWETATRSAPELRLQIQRILETLPPD